MTGKEKGRYEARAQIVKGLAHPSRLLLVDELLRWGERCVYDLTAAVGSDMSTVSRHLLMLKNAGIVKDEKRGRTVCYQLCTKQIKGILKFAECCLRHD
jgi:ArsR family transcriptional regulator